MLAGCAGEQGPPVGVSPPRAVERAARALDASVGRVLLLPADFRGQMHEVMARRTSRGHAEAFEGSVWANAVAAAAWDAATGFPEGSVLVEDAFVKGHPQGFLWMEKTAVGWRYLALEADGSARDEDAGTQACAACHAQATRDGVFQVPKTIAAATAPSTAIVPTPVTSTAAANEARSAGSAALPSSP